MTSWVGVARSLDKMSVKTKSVGNKGNCNANMFCYAAI
jgi:hypothetical protein